MGVGLVTAPGSQGLTLTVLGASGSFPGPGGAASGYLVRTATTSVWLDAGSGTMANLQEHVDLAAVDAVVLSHEHPDHWRDLEGFIVACRWVIQRPPVPVYAPAGLRDLCYFDTEPHFQWHTTQDGGDARIGDIRFTFSRTDHPVETLACRMEAGGRSLVYTADTGPGWAPSALGDAPDVLLSEATFLASDEGRSQHLSGRQAGAAAKACNAGRLVVTHIWPTVDPDAVRREALESFGGDVDLASPGKDFSV